MALPEIKNERELLALAMSLEQRAASRFRALAARMREQGRADLARLLDGLAEEEAGHADKLRLLPGAADLDSPTLARSLAPVLDTISHAPEAETLERASIYECLAEAVRNEEKAFAFFSYVAASAVDGALQRLAESLASEELDHARALRRLRRQAYHQMRNVTRPWPKAASIETLHDLRDAALRGEQAIEAGLRGLSKPVSEVERITQSVDALLSSLQRTHGRTAESGPGHDASTPVGGGNDPRSRSDRNRLVASLHDAHRAFEFYDRVASIASREDVMLTAQALSTLALERIQVLRGLNARGPSRRGTPRT